MKPIYFFLILSFAIAGDVSPDDIDFGNDFGHGINQPKVDVATFLDETTIVTVESSEDLDLGLFEDVNTVIAVKNSRSIIINKVKLNSAKRIGGEDIVTFTEQEELERAQTWIEVTAELARLAEGERTAVTGCSSNEYGDGGSLSGSVSRTFGTTATLDMTMTFPVLEQVVPVQPNMGMNLESASLVSFSFNYNCDVPKGKIGQIFLQPFEVEYLGAKTREWTIKQKTMDRGEWKDIEETVRVPCILEKPRVMCITEKDQLECY